MKEVLASEVRVYSLRTGDRIRSKHHLPEPGGGDEKWSAVSEVRAVMFACSRHPQERVDIEEEHPRDPTGGEERAIFHPTAKPTPITQIKEEFS